MIFVLSGISSVAFPCHSIPEFFFSSGLYVQLLEDDGTGTFTMATVSKGAFLHEQKG